jgi:Tfp pilus assembly protein PilN
MSIFLTKIYFRNSYLKEIHKNFQIKEKEAEELVLLSEDTRKMENFNAKRGRAIKVLDQLQTMLPQEMYLGEIQMTPDEKVSIKGTSEFMSAVFSFVTEFEGNPYFKNVNTDYTKSRKEADKDVSDFGITANIEGLGASEVAPPPPVEAAAEAAPAAESGKKEDKKEEKKEKKEEKK